ncbi:GatB/YqeY domain-containing protein [Sulfuricystis multivorans]|uniref:GatB/YqeY domain-containing protein n=1 Tax=Sulfuricystis multivorans TaxID=2211108 RepID=UPI000F839787|nr:GatB/YqeY domain-containing protein [Sulfuricystis multivorans]
MSLKERILDDMKTALKAKETARLGALRLLIAAIKQREVDERIQLDDAGVIGVIEKMIKQRKDSIAQYEAAKRQDLADAEKFEIEVLSAYMPEPLSADEVAAIVAQAIAESGAKAMAEMGKVMALVKPKIAGRADMVEASRLVKAKLSGR